MTLTLMTAFHVSSATFNAYFPVLLCFCNKLLTENDRKYYLSATYVISSKESQDESLHSAPKCCIFAPAIERTPFVPEGGLLLRPTRVINDGRRRSSMKTPKTAGTGRSGELQNKDSKHTTNDYD